MAGILRYEVMSKILRVTHFPSECYASGMMQADSIYDKNSHEQEGHNQ